jgi:hypothetical protein
VESFLHGGSIEDEATTMVLATSSDDMETFFSSRRHQLWYPAHQDGKSIVADHQDGKIIVKQIKKPF